MELNYIGQFILRENRILFNYNKGKDFCKNVKIKLVDFEYKEMLIILNG